MSILAKINQRESLDKLDKKNKRVVRRAQILAVLGTTNKPLTAREIGVLLGKPKMWARDFVQPRITELKQSGDILEIKRKYDKITQRNVMTYVLNTLENIEKYKNIEVDA